MRDTDFTVAPNEDAIDLTVLGTHPEWLVRFQADLAPDLNGDNPAVNEQRFQSDGALTLPWTVPETFYYRARWEDGDGIPLSDFSPITMLSIV